MARLAQGDTFTQIVRFDVRPDKQDALIAAVSAEAERWIRHRPGFVSSTFHASHDGRHVLNYAQWASEDAFRDFTQDPETGQLQAAIRAVDPELKPDAVSYRVVRSIDPV